MIKIDAQQKYIRYTIILLQSYRTMALPKCRLVLTAKLFPENFQTSGSIHDISLVTLKFHNISKFADKSKQVETRS